MHGILEQTIRVFLPTLVLSKSELPQASREQISLNDVGEGGARLSTQLGQYLLQTLLLLS